MKAKPFRRFCLRCKRFAPVCEKKYYSPEPIVINGRRCKQFVMVCCTKCYEQFAEVRKPL